MLQRMRTLPAIGAVLVGTLGVVTCIGEGDSGGTTSGGTTSGGTSGGATEVGPYEPNGSQIYLSKQGSPCVPSKNGTVVISGRGKGMKSGDVFSVQVYKPAGTKNLVQSAGRPYFKSSVNVLSNGTFTWEFHCGKRGFKPYKVGAYGFALLYGGKTIKTDAFDVSEYRG